MADESDDRSNRDPAPAVTRSVRLLGLLAEAGAPMTLTELATGLGLAKSSTANLCLALEAADMVARVGAGYRLGHRVAELGGAFAAQFNQMREFYNVIEASPVLNREVVQLAILDGSDALYLARHEGHAGARVGTPLGSRLPAALSATGRALLSRRSDATVTALLAGQEPFPALTTNSVRSVSQVIELLQQARRTGWAVDYDESFSGIVGVAVALEGWAPSDPDIALGVAIPAPDATPERIKRTGLALQEAAAALTNPFSAAARG